MPTEYSKPEEEIFFLTVDQVLILNREVILRYSPSESFNVINPVALESAVSQPQASWGGRFLYESIAAMAAAYIISLVQNHAFENGNKRVGFAVASTFLRMNGRRLTLTEDEAVELTLRVATGDLEREDATDILQRNMEDLRPLPRSNGLL